MRAPDEEVASNDAPTNVDETAGWVGWPREATKGHQGRQKTSPEIDRLLAYVAVVADAARPREERQGTLQ